MRVAPPARIALVLFALSGCAVMRPSVPVGPPPVEAEGLPSRGSAGTGASIPGMPARPARGVVADADKPEWMRALVLPDLPLRWYPRVSGYLELYKSDPRFREIIRGWLRRADAYRAPIEAVLAREHVPKGLIYVAMIESGFMATALSSKAAGGFWQFRPDVGRGYGLEVSFWVDERRDLEKSTTAAARYLSDLHHRFGTWELALAGYNAGVFAVLESIVRYNTNDFWTLCQVEAGLPWETTEYVPKVMAVGIVDRNRAAFGFDEVGGERLPETEVAMAPPGVTFEALATRAAIATDDLVRLNPIYSRKRTPPDRGAVALRVPRGTREKAERAFASLRADLSPVVVRANESLVRFARARKIPLARVRRLNAISDDSDVTPGTTLLIPAGDRKAAPSAAVRSSTRSARAPK